MAERNIQGISRRGAIGRLLAGTAVAVGQVGFSTSVFAKSGKTCRISDGVLSIDIDGTMASRIALGDTVLADYSAGDALRLADGKIIDNFTLLDCTQQPVSDRHGKGTAHILRGVKGDRVERLTTITLYDAYPGMALIDVTYRNIGSKRLDVAGWYAATHNLRAHKDGAWSFSGASHPDRRDWVQPVVAGFAQPNFMGMNASDYGGGIPVSAVWRRDGGIAVGHVETHPELVSLPVTAQPGGTRIGIEADRQMPLAPGETFALPQIFVMAHKGDFYPALDTFRKVMTQRGIAAPAIPESSYEPIWCAWGYERHFTTQQVFGTLDKAKSLGLDWAVLDDGWQTSEGDWDVDLTKFPRGGADMKAFADRIKAAGMRPRLWLAPLAVDPGTRMLRDHPEMLLLGKDGAAQDVTWWDAYTLCPAYQPTVDFFRALVRKIIGEWGFEGIKMDGQHLNGVAPCYNPAHNHARPEESFEKMQDFWIALYEEAISINPDAIIELCPCGDAFAFHNMPGMNHTPSSDPLSSWQVRLKGKTFKAIMGPSAPYAGDHVELSDGGNDFASSYGIGAVLSTKFTWPKDTDKPIESLPPGGYVLTPEKEALWRQWIDLYRANMLPKGHYRGDLYDIGFDKPEGHMIETGAVRHYAFYADSWSGPVELRGLQTGTRYRVEDVFHKTTLGFVTADAPRVSAEFSKFLVLTATPETGAKA
ncbi:alpha-galactosidase [Tsuneonella suprasediminis]|uniref:Alpha-galactosidase n=1 Tax=Tsuneonella suprasediminis TaxID=2306996 RepID=A0A419R5Y7_9SPHN|nr:glycoside hydrolase family 36 protein [Tsuneonella suprasediminis]RJX71168.1 alpha-galactosidase [Tsuneonella suprasediminis]